MSWTRLDDATTSVLQVHMLGSVVAVTTRRSDDTDVTSGFDFRVSPSAPMSGPVLGQVAWSVVHTTTSNRNPLAMMQTGSLRVLAQEVTSGANAPYAVVDAATIVGNSAFGLAGQAMVLVLFGCLTPKPFSCSPPR